MFEWLEQRGPVELVLASVVQRDAAVDARRLPPQRARRRAQRPLREGEPHGGERGERRGEVEALGLNEVADEHGKRTPCEREPEVGVDPAAEQLEVVTQHEERTDRDEHEESGADRRHADEAERARDQQATGTEPDEPSSRNGGVQRAAVQLVECMGGDADGKEEREEGREEARAVGVGREASRR